MGKKYIDAEKLKKSIGNYVEGAHAALNPIDGDADYYKGKIDACKDIQEFITPLQQEQPEVDLEKEIDKFLNETGAPYVWCNDDEQKEWCNIIARHFCELGRKQVLQEIFDMINNAIKYANKQEQPEYGYITTEYIPGKKPRWKVSDILAYYINNSDEEGEAVLGKVVNIEPDEDRGWLYTFENEDVWDEESLITEGTYEK